MKSRIRKMTLLQKLVCIASISMLLILLVNVLIFAKLNQLNRQIGNVYTDNTNLEVLGEKLNNLHLSVEEYVSNRSTDAIENYYREEEAFRNQVEQLNDKISDDQVLLAEKNIRGLSESYMKLAAEIIQAKRGRNVKKYGALSEEANILQEDIRNCIESLNTEQFSRSSQKYLALIQKTEKMQLLCEGLLVLMMAGNILATIFLTGRLMKPLRNLTDAAYSAAEGNLEMEELPIVDMDEVGIVTDAFNKMLSSIRHYIAQIHENMERENALKENEFRMQGYLKDAQLKYLQAQIKPHFLFNTLNAGVQLSMMEGAPKTQRLLENTAAFYRYNVSKSNKSATIGEEIAQVDAYIYISEVRFGDSFIFEKNVDETLMERKIPSMILQPLVENTFKYGICDLEYTGRIELTVEKTDTGVRISIWDNGNGITEERIRQIMNGPEPVTGGRTDSNGLGMHNVKERLMLFFDNKATFEIESEGEGMGTEIIITIPDEEDV